MSLALEQGSRPNGLEVKTGASCSCCRDGVSLYGPGPRADTKGTNYCYLSMEDFAELVLYVLTNTNLSSDGKDARIRLVERIRVLQLMPGYGSDGGTRWGDPADLIVWHEKKHRECGV